jgi:hypothetical protein
MAHVLAPFGRIALPAFLVVVLSGSVNALIELGDITALWSTGYGQVLLIKVSLVALIAGASFWHARRLRPRLLAANPHPEERSERRHWRLLRSQPLLGIAVAGAVAVLVAFPLPPRQLKATDEAKAATPACNPCPLRRPRANELSVAEQGGSNIVAAWITRQPKGLTGEVHLLDSQAKPAKLAFQIAHANQRSCGRGCATFTTSGLPGTLRVSLRERGHRYRAELPTTWQRGRSVQARRWLNQAVAAMRRLRSVREYEQVASVPGKFAITNYRLRSPDRFAYDTSLGGQSIVIARSQWSREAPDRGWQRELYGGGGPAFRTRSWFVWSNYAQAVRLLGIKRVAGRRTAIIALMDPGSPAWWRLYIDMATKRVFQTRLITSAHFMTQVYYDFNRPLAIRPPSRAHR